MDIRPVGNFASVVDAVRCAVEVQREMAGRNTDVPSDRRIEFRLGINVGDIIRDGATFMVTRSTPQRGSKPWPSQEGYALAG